MIRMMIWSNDISTQNLYESKTKKTIHKKKKKKRLISVHTRLIYPNIKRRKILVNILIENLIFNIHIIKIVNFSMLLFFQSSTLTNNLLIITSFVLSRQSPWCKYISQDSLLSLTNLSCVRLAHLQMEKTNRKGSSEINQDDPSFLKKLFVISHTHIYCEF